MIAMDGTDDSMVFARVVLLLAGLLAGVACVSALPLMETFEGDFPPSGWQTFETGDGTTGWTRSGGATSPWGYSAASQHDPNVFGGTIRQWLITPALYADSAHAELAFYVRSSGQSVSFSDTLYVLLSTTGTAAGDFSVRLAVLSPGRDFDSAFVRRAVGLRAYSGTVVHIALVRAVRNAAASTILLDNVGGPLLILPPALPTFPEPADQSSNASVTSALTWIADTETSAIDLYLSRTASDVQQMLPAARVIANGQGTRYVQPSHLLSSHVYYWRVVTRNPWFQTVGPVWSFTTGTGPLGGTYAAGGTNADFAGLTEAVAALTATGVSAPTVISVAPGAYSGPVVISAVPGASAESPVTIRNAGGGAVTVSCGSTVDTATVTLAGARYLTLDGIDITALSGTVRHCLIMTDGSQHNTVRNATLRGQSAGLANSDGILLRGTACEFNRFSMLTVRRAVRGIQLEGTVSGVGTGNEIDSCHVDSVRCGIYLKYQSACTVQANDIAVNGGSADEVDGIWAGAMLPDDTLEVLANRIHGMKTSSVYAVGIRVKPDSATAVVRIRNNFIYGFQNTGGSQARALYISSGQTEVADNSVLVNDVSATGAAYALYIGTSAATGNTRIVNNIFCNRELSSPAYNIFLMLNTSPLESDYNVFQGTGSSYRVGHLGVDLPGLADWRGATGGDLYSLEGDPGFVNSNDLHILPAYGLANRNGTAIADLLTDIDGEPRWTPPCRGADDYAFAAPSADVAVVGFAEPASQVVEHSAVPVQIMVQNRSAATVNSVPLRLYFNNVPLDSTALALTPWQTDTVTLVWNTPAAPSTGRLKAQGFLAGDADPANDSAAVWVNVVRAPLSGVYSVGADHSSFRSISDAVRDVQERGISGPVVFSILPGAYNEPILLGPVAGTSGDHTVTFRPADSLGGVTLSADSGVAVVIFSGARHVVLDGLAIVPEYPCLSAVRMDSDADSNRILNCTLTGSALAATTACGVIIAGGGNDGNVLRDLAISGFYYGIRLDGSAGADDRGNTVERCTITTTRTAIRADYQDSTRLVSNRIRPGFDGAGACYGVYLGAQSSGMQVIADGNEITGGRSATGCCGVYSASGEGDATVQNNMISGWTASGADAVYGILVGSGHADVRFNSVWMNDIAGSGDVVALADTGLATHTVAQNNVLQISETANNAWCLVRSGGTLSSDFNAFSDRTGGNGHAHLGRSGNTDYATLSLWQAGTGGEAHSVTGDPGFVDSVHLHILPNISLLNHRGVSSVGVDSDFDGQLRDDPPDIGADEYDFLAAQHDLAVSWAQIPGGRYEAAFDYDIAVRVVNQGTVAASSVPLLLYFGGIPCGSASVSVAAGGADTALVHWATPDTGLASGVLKAQCFLTGDQIAVNDTATAEVTVVGPPLAGHYSIGGVEADFATPAEAVDHLSMRGVSDEVALRITPGIYTGTLCIPAIPGAGETHPVTIESLYGLQNPALLRAATGEAVILLDSARYVNLADMEIVAAGNCTTAVTLRSGSSHCEIRRCGIHGADSAASITTGIFVHGDGCHNNLIDGVTVSGAFTGIAIGGDATAGQDSGNTVNRSMILNARYGISAGKQVDCVINGNEIVPGSPSPLAAACYGVYIAGLGTGGSVQISGNRIHGFADGSLSASNRAAGIYAAAGSGAAVMAVNNFIYGFSNAGHLKINGFYLSSGTNTILHNSVRLDDMPWTNDLSAICISTGSSQVIENNILVSLEGHVTSYGILQYSGGSPQCNGNDIFGTSPLFAVGRVNGVSYATLTAWQAAGYDSSGIAANPGFISGSDLHIADTSGVVDGRGIVTGLVTTDIDGDVRGNPPDIGADEYHPLPAVIRDLAVYTQSDSVRLVWRHSARASGYRVYAGNSAVSAQPQFLVASVTDTAFVEPVVATGQGKRFYVVTAVEEGVRMVGR